jgi:hypothetical protein
MAIKVGIVRIANSFFEAVPRRYKRTLTNNLLYMVSYQFDKKLRTFAAKRFREFPAQNSAVKEV